ncbi:MAG TPA: hypothetical protein VMH37_06735 [Candidatus Binataceae bacterium]|nr:hypothetical protein [Candidatus Binataceae bacterium]
MPPSVHGPRAQEKLDVILGQVTGLRSRLNWLAAQHVIYLLFAIGITTAVVFFAGAVLLTPMQFLVVGIVTAIAGLYALVLTLRSGWRRRSNAARAAALADDRAGLKGRLTTIVQTVSFGRRSVLWSYLVEDALSHREEFVPRQIERRRIARSWWAPVAAMALATVLIPLARSHHKLKMAAAAQGGDSDMTVDLDDLHLRPAEPGDNTGLKVRADSATMARLREKMAREGEAATRGDGGKFSGLLNRARNLADSVQSKLRGDSSQKQRLTLKLADNDAGLDPSNPRGPDLNRNTRHGDQAGQFKRDNPVDDEATLPPIDDSLREPDAEPSAGENGDAAAESGARGSTLNGANDPSHNGPDDDVARGDQSYNGGAVHGIGADPDSLFGEASKSRMSTEGFEIAIEARPVDQGIKGAGQAYLPPKVHTPLNTHQEPDEPIARAAVPPDDRTTIERVFER